MTRLHTLKSILLGAVLLMSVYMQAQGWERKYNIGGFGEFLNLYPTHDGSYLATASFNAFLGTNVVTVPGQAFLTKIAGDGHMMWFTSYDSTGDQQFASIQTSDGKILFQTRSINQGGLFHNNLLKVDTNGNKIWLKQDVNFSSAFIDQAYPVAGGGLLEAYSYYDSTISKYKTGVKKYNSNIDSIWDRTYFMTDSYSLSYKIIGQTGGQYVAYACVTDTMRTLASFFKIDNNGNMTPLFTYNINSPRTFAVQMAQDGNILASMFVSQGGYEITKIAQNGHVMWDHIIAIEDSMFYPSIYIKAVERNGRYTLVTTEVGMPGLQTNNARVLLYNIDSLGNVGWEKNIPLTNLGTYGDIYSSPSATLLSPDGGYIFGGGLWTPMAGNPVPYLIKADSNGIVYPASLSGYIYGDYNNNCYKNPTDQYLSPVYVTLSSNRDTFTTLSADSGFYLFNLDTGFYNISVAAPSPYWRPGACVPAAVRLTGDTAVNLPLIPDGMSPYITISGNIPRLRPCQPAVYTAQYCNMGTAPFTGTIVLTVDTILHVDSASRPWLSNTANQYTFAVDTLAPGQCAQIQLYCTVTCDQSLLGRTVCIDAQAFQDTIINPSPQWDGSNLRMAASYNKLTDTITFTLKNRGSGDMGGPKGMIVIEDNVILMTTQVQLLAGAQITQQVKANGATWRATAYQTEHNPYAPFTTAAIEGAGVNGSGGVSTGYYMQYPYNPYTSYEYNSCRIVSNSWDPNAKEVSPAGVGPNHLIDTGTALEYTIDFQNTGNDTAFMVRITDTLAPGLDPATFRMEMSSAPSTVEIEGRNVLVFTFYPVFLPDSGHDQLGSTGFVKFGISPKAGAAIGTVINNRASIYFDYNQPVITNTAKVAIGQIFISGIANLYPDRQVLISAYPNPFEAYTTLKVEGKAFSELSLRIYDLSGKLVGTQKVENTNSFLVQRSSLSAGSYTFEIADQERTVGTGRITVR